MVKTHIQKRWFLRLWVMLCGICMAMPSVHAQKWTISGLSQVMLLNTNDKNGLIYCPTAPIEGTVITLKGGDSFRLYAGTLTTGGNSFDGKIVAGLVRNVGDEDILVDILKEFPLKMEEDIPVYEMACKVKEETEVHAGDVIRLLTTINGEDFNPVGKYPGTNVTDRIPAVNYELPILNIKLPMDIPGVTVTLGETALWPDKIIKGMNFYFFVKAEDPENTVVTVSIDGSVITPNDDGMYGISNVTQDHDIEIETYDKKSVIPYKIVDLTDGSCLTDLLSDAEKACLIGLKVKGQISDEDLKIIREQMASIEIVDLTESRFENDANDIPNYAFSQNKTIRIVKLPEGITGSGNNAFYYMSKLEFIVLPKSLNQFGLNEFFGCQSLKTVWAKWNPIEAGLNPPLGFHIPPCAFRATTYMQDGTLIVPKGCKNAYAYADIWGNFSKIREETPADPIKLERPFEYYANVQTAKMNGRQVLEVIPQTGGCLVAAEGADGMPVEVFDASGREVSGATISGGSAFVALTSGFYVVRVGDAAGKVMVR